METQSAEPGSIIDSTAQRVDAFVLITGRIGLLVGLARHGRDSPECRSIPAEQKNAPERVLVEVETSHCDWEHRSSLVDDLAFGASAYVRRITP
jgi:hypothetical protein